MRHCLFKFLFIASFSLAFAALTPAQKFIERVSSPVRAGGTMGDNRPYDGYDGYAGYRTHRHHGYSFSGTFEPSMGYEHGDSTYVPSAYMDYDKALALGKRMLEEQFQPSQSPVQASLGEIARNLRQGLGSATPNAKTLSAPQDNNGQLIIYKGGGAARR